MPTRKKRELTTSAEGRTVVLSYSRDKLPNINIKVTRAMEPQ
jgi:hypothetical protein